ncbi:MAG: sulfatase-like hydrolase/transferase, partial [Bacteroidales bacterium]|nr:sulfatase-like hydrolase/transferase [Bacteroidales bacterium]
MKKAPLVYFAVAFLYLINTSIVSGQITTETQKPPNIVLIMADDMGFSDIGCYGGEINTPNIDSIAAKGIRFTQFYNTARCWTTRASILSGYYAQQVNIGYPARAAFPQWGHLIPHHLKQAGYRSYHSGKWHVNNVKMKLADGGFDRSFDCTHSEDHHLEMKPEYLILDDKRFSEIDREIDGDYYSTSVITDFS